MVWRKKIRRKKKIPKWKEQQQKNVLLPCGKHRQWHYISSFQVVNHNFILYQHILFMLAHDGMYIFGLSVLIKMSQFYDEKFSVFIENLHKFSKRICFRQGTKKNFSNIMIDSQLFTISPDSVCVLRPAYKLSTI